MKEVKSPKKPLIYYYVLVLAILCLFNLIVSPMLMRPQIDEVDYGTFMDMIEEKESHQHRDHLYQQGQHQSLRDRRHVRPHPDRAAA